MMKMAEIKKSHAQLYQLYIDHRQEILQAPDKFERGASVLLEEMRQASAQVTSVDDYDWLRSAVDKWRSVYISTFNKPREISLHPPRQTLQPPVTRQEEMLWSEAALRRWVQDHAFAAAKSRVVHRLHALTPEELLRNMPSTKDEEQQDWHNANSQLAFEILDARITLDQIRPESYWRLEQSWLEDIKRIKAFHIWMERGANLETPERTLDNYYEACRQMDGRLWRSLKLGPRAFSAVSDYLESRYLKNGQVDAKKSTPLITAKARRLWETTGEIDSDKNWRLAADYVRNFYNSIVPAIAEGDLDAHARITSEMLQAVERRHLLVNVFEMAVAMFFLRTKDALLSEQDVHS